MPFVDRKRLPTPQKINLLFDILNVFVNQSKIFARSASLLDNERRKHQATKSRLLYDNEVKSMSASKYRRCQ